MSRWPVDDLNDHPGACWWSRKENGQPYLIKFNCPCGCGIQRRHFVVESIEPRPDIKAHAWDGVEWQPTLHQLLVHPDCRWQGYLTKGMFVACFRHLSVI